MKIGEKKTMTLTPESCVYPNVEKEGKNKYRSKSGEKKGEWGNTAKVGQIGKKLRGGKEIQVEGIKKAVGKKVQFPGEDWSSTPSSGKIRMSGKVGKFVTWGGGN